MATTVSKYRVRCTTEDDYVYTWSETVPTVCPNNSGHTIETTTIAAVETLSTNVMTPTVPTNEHNMNGKKSYFSWTPTGSSPDYDLKKLYFKVDSTTHNNMYLWGVKMKVDGYNVDDHIVFNITDKDNLLGYGADLVLKTYASWYLEPEEGKLECKRPPSGAPGQIPDGMYIRIDYSPKNNATVRKVWCNWILTEKDGDEQ